MRTNEDVLEESVGLSGADDCHPDTADDESPQGKIRFMVRTAHREVPLFDLLEELSSGSAKEEESIRAALIGLLAGGEIELTPTRKLVWKGKCRCKQQDNNQSAEFTAAERLNAGHAASATA